MKIDSGFRDYYDYLQAFGQEETTYHRKALIYNNVKLFDELPSLSFNHLDIRQSFQEFTFKERIVGFCGKIYSLLEVRIWDGWANDKTQFCHSFKEFDECVQQNVRKKALREYHDNSSYSAKRKKQVEKHFSDFENQRNNQKLFDVIAEFTDNVAPVFYGERDYSYFDVPRPTWDLTINCKLAKIEFQRVVPAEQAFQEIQMYLYNVAKPEIVIPTPDDKTMAEIKGFDKFSFRKDKKIG